MTTLTKLVEDGVLVPIEIYLEGADMAHRCLFGTQEFLEWLNNVAAVIPEYRYGSATSPNEQVDAIFSEYILGEHLHTDRRFKRLTHAPDLDVWELKTIELRMFGWVPQRDHFILTFGDTKENTLRMNNVDTFKARTKFIRDNELMIDDPMHVTSKEYQDVLSDKN